MNPTAFLIFLLAISIGALIVNSLMEHRVKKRLRLLARSRQMHFSNHDRARLSSKIAPLLPVAGAAGVRVSNLIYGQSDTEYRFIFTAEFTVGVLKLKHRNVRVARLCEQKESTDHPGELRLTLADHSLPLLQQYEQLVPEI